MGLRMYLARIPPARLEALRGSLDEWYRLDADEGRMFDAEYEETGGYPVLGGTAELGHAELQKSWDALHFLLDPARRTGDSDRKVSTPGGAAVVGWHPMPEFYLDHFDYLPRYSTAEEVRVIAESLNETDFDAVMDEHEDALASSHTYSHGKGNPIDERTREGLRRWFDVMRQFYTEAARQEQAAFVTLS